MISSIRVDPENLREKLNQIVGERNPSSSPGHLAKVEAFIESEFRRYGLNVEKDTFTYWGRSYHNVIARIGRSGANPLIIVGAHFDSVRGSPGADDNASGVAVLLESARILSSLRIKSNVFFCAFNLEELNMIGSTHFARKLKARGAKVAAMLSLEMVGYTELRPGAQQYPIGLGWLYPDRGDFIGVIGNWRSSMLLRKMSRLMKQISGLSVETLTVFANGMFLPAARLSDHSPFWDLGYPALMITDTAFFRNPHYHRSTDTLETLDLNFMARVCEGVVTGVLGL